MDKLVSRNIVLFIIFIVLLIIVQVFRSRSPFGREQTSFALDPAKKITKIELSEGDQKVILERESEGWRVNGGYEARKSAITFISGILKEMKIKSPVSPDLFRTEITQKKITPVKVSIFDGRRLLKFFYVYRTSSNMYGNIMKLREKSKPFIVCLPGFEGDIGSGFITNELFWRPYTVFTLLPSEISAISFENNLTPSLSFKISYSDGKYTLSDAMNNLAGWDTSRVKRYVSYFVNLPFESWAFDIPENERERIKTTGPCYIISVTKTDGEVVRLSLWERHMPVSDVKDSDRMWGKTNNADDFFVMRYFDADPVIKEKTYFFTQ
jgi:hypothetical protein